MNLHNLFYLVLLTFFPGLELRLSIPVGIWNRPVSLPFVGTVNGLGMPLVEVLSVVIATNIILGPVVYFALEHLLSSVRRINFLDSLYKRILLRTQKRAYPLVEKYGLLGIALFIAIPLPGSGSWSGALIAFFLGLSYRKFALANLIGILIAGSIVTAATLGLIEFL